MTFDELRLFNHLAGTLHFSRSAAACNISPSALSRTVQRLEDELECTLFQRDKRFVALTQAGKTFAGYVQETLERHEEMRRTLSEQDQHVRGEISLFCSVTAAQSLLNSVLPTFRMRYPLVSIHIHTGDSADSIDRVLDGTADISIAARPDVLSDALDFHDLTRTPLVFIGPRGNGSVGDFVERFEARSAGSVELSELKDIPFILADRALSRRAADRWFRARGIRPKIYAEVAGHEAIIALVQLGFGLGVVPKLVLDQSPLAAGIQILDLTPALPEYRIGLCAQRRRLASTAVNAFWQVGKETTLPAPAGG